VAVGQGVRCSPHRRVRARSLTPRTPPPVGGRVPSPIGSLWGGVGRTRLFFFSCPPFIVTPLCRVAIHPPQPQNQNPHSNHPLASVVCCWRASTSRSSTTKAEQPNPPREGDRAETLTAFLSGGWLCSHSLARRSDDGAEGRCVCGSCVCRYSGSMAVRLNGAATQRATLPLPAQDSLPFPLPTSQRSGCAARMDCWPTEFGVDVMHDGVGCGWQVEWQCLPLGWLHQPTAV